MNAKLEIIITHYNEPWAVCSKLFKMLDVQRGVGQGEARVTIIQDGSEGALDTAKLMKQYPFVTRVIEIPHGGVSAARNAGIDEAEAEWILFMDCDDMLYACDSLRTMLDAIEDEKGRADLIWGQMMIENRTKSGVWISQEGQKNNVFVHGKAWRLSWLKEKGIRFREELRYSEDSLFCEEAALELDPKRIGRAPKPVVMWCMRENSCTTDKENERRNRRDMLRHRIMLPEICRQRGKEEDALTTAARGIMDCFHELTGGTLTGSEKTETERKATEELIRPWGFALWEIEPEDYEQLMKVSRQATINKRMMAKDADPGEIGAWLRKMKDTYGE